MDPDFLSRALEMQRSEAILGEGAFRRLLVNLILV